MIENNLRGEYRLDIDVKLVPMDTNQAIQTHSGDALFLTDGSDLGHEAAAFANIANSLFWELINAAEGSLER